MTGDEKSTLEKLLELVASQSGLLTDGLQSGAFEVFVVIGDSHSESRIVKVSENVMSTEATVPPSWRSPYCLLWGYCPCCCPPTTR